MRNVLVFQKDNGRHINTYPIHLEMQNSEVSDEDYFDEAWKCAVEDGLEESEKDKYEFKFT